MNKLIDQAIVLMKAEISKYGLELLQRYPNDLLVHDRCMLERALHPGAKLAWMVGHCHTHLVTLGLSPKENENVTYLTNMASEDRFYLVAATHSGVTLKEVNRKGFVDLAHTPVPYEREGDRDQFWLLKNKSRVGFVSIDFSGNFQERRYEAAITPVSGISEIDRAALGLWADQSMVSLAGTLFVRSSINWSDAIHICQAA